MDMNRTMHPMTRPFFHEGTRDEAVLLIHGFTGTAATMHPLADVLRSEGYAVSAILLPGHGETLAAMERTGWKDWLDGAETALRELLARYRRVDVVGFSMGGLIALELASRHPVGRLVTISAPIRVQDGVLARFTPLLRFFRRYQPWLPDPLVEGELRDPFTDGYPGFPVKNIADLRHVARLAQSGLPKVTAPVLITQSGQDQSVDLASPYLIYDRIASVYRELLILENSRHNALLGPERERLFTDIVRFLGLSDETVRGAAAQRLRRIGTSRDEVAP